MNKLLKQLIYRTTLRHRRQEDCSEMELKKGERHFFILLKRYLKDFVLIVAGIFSAAFGLKGFLLTNHFIDGGTTGVSLLISELSDLPLSILLFGINIPFIILALRVIGREFALKAALAISGLTMVVATVHFPDVTQDNLLVAVFGGFFLGMGTGLAVRGGAVIDGTEILAIFLSRKIGVTMGDIIIAINVLIFSAAAYFLSVEAALYSMITYMAASKTIDFVVEGIEEYMGVTIVSSHSEEIRKMIATEMERGVTVFSGKDGYGTHGMQKHADIIYTVLTRLEINKLNTEIEKIDPHAFIVMSAVKDAKGGMIKKRVYKHEK